MRLPRERLGLKKKREGLELNLYNYNIFKRRICRQRRGKEEGRKPGAGVMEAREENILRRKRSVEPC